MEKFKCIILLAGIAPLIACAAAMQTPPTQVVYRFDNHRSLELTGFNCEGGLTYIDTQRGIRHQIYDVSDKYRVFTKKFIHPSERYIVIPEFNDAESFFVSKDFGQTWVGARMMPGGGAQRYGDSHPTYESVDSLTVINDQGFLKTKSGDLYISSKPFDDPRLEPGGDGIPYTYTNYSGVLKHDRLMPGVSGMEWGREYISWNAVDGPAHWDIAAHKPNWQNIPNKVPEVKNYTGWDHMQCNPDIGLPASEQGK